MQLWTARWASRATLVLQTVPSRNIRKHDENVMQSFGKQRVGKDQARRSPKIIAVGPGTTVFVETSAWELALGGTLFENTSASEWTIVCSRTSGFQVTPRNPVGKHKCELA